jgi:glycosyltransferase involved in cell wall biosynthesis
MKDFPDFITIGMPVYNDKDFIEESLNSILQQTYKDFILIISDDGSTDGSEEICRSYAENDNRIKYIRQPVNLGISKNMEFLLKQANTKYFMWAGDDDVYSIDFIEKMINQLERNPQSVSAFGTCAIIDENGEKLDNDIDLDYSNTNRFIRLKNFIKNATDYFGYGVFVTAEIKEVKFPVWWWPNRKTPYNNIFPTLCYYLAKGDYVSIKGAPLFFKRVKSEQKTHHILVGKNNAIKESLAFYIRRFNLALVSFTQIKKGCGIFEALKLYPYLHHYWFVIPIWKQTKLAINAFLNNRILRRNQKQQAC